MEIDRNGLEVLERDECLRLLDGVAVGRIAFTARALPCILPVNFRLLGDQILFRTGEGTKLATATRNTVVGFEVDDFDNVTETGWSVLVVGVARRLADEQADDAIADLGIPRWAPSDDGHVVAISTEIVTGRRLLPDTDDGAAPAGRDLADLVEQDLP